MKVKSLCLLLLSIVLMGSFVSCQNKPTSTPEQLSVPSGTDILTNRADDNIPLVPMPKDFNVYDYQDVLSDARVEEIIGGLKKGQKYDTLYLPSADDITILMNAANETGYFTKFSDSYIYFVELTGGEMSGKWPDKNPIAQLVPKIEFGKLSKSIIESKKIQISVSAVNMDEATGYVSVLKQKGFSFNVKENPSSDSYSFKANNSENVGVDLLFNPTGILELSVILQ